MNIFITGDTHREFQRIWEFAEETPVAWSKEDVLIILGDAGINYYLDDDDRSLKYELSMLPFTLLCIKGNHELHADQIDSYQEIPWHGGTVYCEDEYPNLLFAKDGEIYDLNGKKAIVIGGAYSVDKYVRLRLGSAWFDTEQPSDAVKDFTVCYLSHYQGWDGSNAILRMSILSGRQSLFNKLLIEFSKIFSSIYPILIHLVSEIILGR